MSYLVLDVETTISNKGNPFDQSNKLVMVGLLKDKEVAIYDIEYSVDPYKELLDNIQIAVDEADVLVGFNIKFDLHWLRRYGINFSKKRIWDCQLVEFILRNQSSPYPSLNATAEYYDLGTKLDEVKENYWKNGIDTDKVPKEILSDYLKRDVELTEQVMSKQKEELAKRPELERLVSLHNQDLLVLEEMEANGLKYDYDKSTVLGDELEEQISKLNKKLYDFHAYDDFNPSSGEHLSAFLYGGNVKERFQRPVGHYKTGLRAGEVKYKWEERDKGFPRLINPLPNTELKKEGFFSTNEDSLRKLKPRNNEGKDILKIILTRSTMQKRMTTYYHGLVKLIDEMKWKKDTIHGQLNQCVAKTGRLSSSKPNLQNFDGEIKTLFTTRYGESNE
jgi:DNA polymerase I-like protein with 3'-5' exonuclease and polymerase domains